MIPQTAKNYKGAKHSNADVTLTERNTVPTSGKPAINHFKSLLFGLIPYEISDISIENEKEDNTVEIINKVKQQDGERNAASVNGNASTNHQTIGNVEGSTMSNCNVNNSTEIVLSYNELLRKKDEIIEKLLTSKFM